MTYEEIVKKIKQVAGKIDKGAIKEHVAIEVDIEGEGEGAFYVELNKDKVTVEPYEYYDSDCKIRVEAGTLMKLVTGKIDVVKVLEDGNIKIDGEIDKAIFLFDILKTRVNKKPSVSKKSGASKKPVEKESDTKKTV